VNGTTAEREQIFGEWMAGHGAIVVRTARAFARGADRDDLEQELLVAIWRAIPAFRGGSSVATFLYRVAHNAALTWKRSERSRREREQRFSLELAHGGPAVSAAHDGEEMRQLDRLYSAIRELPALDRSLLLLSLDGVAYAEMATIHGLTPNHVGVRLTRARQALAARLQGDPK
jgi:RNA polymerase sigma factor (sigma-70 family)